MKKLNFKNIKEKRREITLIAVTLMVMTLFFTGYSLGKGFGETKIEANGKIAEPILIVENNPPVTITTTNNSGWYDFKVKNYDETGKITDVSLNYTIEILSTIGESVSFKMYKNDQEIALENQKTEEFILTNQEEQEDLYRLEIQYDTSMNSQDILENIQIKVHSEQCKI